MERYKWSHDLGGYLYTILLATWIPSGIALVNSVTETPNHLMLCITVWVVGVIMAFLALNRFTGWPL